MVHRLGRSLVPRRVGFAFPERLCSEQELTVRGLLTIGTGGHAFVHGEVRLYDEKPVAQAT
jgi:hypothetical protein